MGADACLYYGACTVDWVGKNVSGFHMVHKGLAADERYMDGAWEE